MFLLATVGSLVGGTMISAAVPEGATAALTAGNRGVLITGILLELVNALCVFGIGSMLAPSLRLGSDRAATAYSVLRTVEGVFCTVVVLAPLSLFFAGDLTGFTAGIFAVREGVYALLVPLFFSLGALVLYGTMFRFRMVPRFVSVWGFAAAVMIFFVGLAGFILPNGLGESIPMMLGLPIILNELFLGVWLIVKGFREPVTGAVNN
jgi:hypothetical protein